MLQRLLVVIINIAIFVGLLGLIEYGARTIQTRRLGRTGLVQPATIDRWTGWRNTPGYARPDIQHNQQGFRRDQEVSLEKPSNTVRIFFMGGSTAYGCEGLYPSLDPQWEKLFNRDLIDVYLERKLRQRHPERNWEVVNAAVNEYRMHQHLILLYAQVLRFHPDLVVFLDGHNDMSGLMGKSLPYDPFTDTPHQGEFNSLTQPKSWRALFYINAMWLRNNSVFYDILYRRVLDQSQNNAFGPGADPLRPVKSPVQLSDLPAALQTHATERIGQSGYYVHMAERLLYSLRQEGIPAVFALQPELILSAKPLTPVEATFADFTRQAGQQESTYLWEQLRPKIAADMTASAAKHQYPFVDLGDTFNGVKEKTFTDYCHLNPRGNEAIAERLYQTIAATQLPQLLAKTMLAKPAGQ